jgi:hypothetical protein
MNQGIKQIKQIHKDLAVTIRQYRSFRKEDREADRPDGMVNLWSLQYEIDRLSNESRYRHIAYCLNCGTDYDAIEKPREENKLEISQWNTIKKYQEQYRILYEENVCNSKQPEAVQ